MATNKLQEQIAEMLKRSSEESELVFETLQAAIEDGIIAKLNEILPFPMGTDTITLDNFSLTQNVSKSEQSDEEVSLVLWFTIRCGVKSQRVSKLLTFTEPTKLVSSWNDGADNVQLSTLIDSNISTGYTSINVFFSVMHEEQQYLIPAEKVMHDYWSEGMEFRLES